MASVVFVGLLLKTTAGGGEPWLSYEPAIVRLQGVVELRERYGPPNYGERPETDKKVVVPVLRLAKPISVRGDPNSELNQQTEEHVTEIHLVFLSAGDAVLHEGQIVIVTGALFHSFTGHHATKVLMKVRTIEPVVS